MNRNTQEHHETTPEQLLSAAGIASTVVDSCGDVACGWCDPEPVTLAA